jgi:hypothetical protein
MSRLIVLAVLILVVLFIGSIIVGNANDGLLTVQLKRDDLEEIGSSLFGEPEALKQQQLKLSSGAPDSCLDKEKLVVADNSRCIYQITQPDFGKIVLTLTLEEGSNVALALSAKSRLTVKKVLPDSEGETSMTFDIFQGESTLSVDCNISGSSNDEAECRLEIK